MLGSYGWKIALEGIVYKTADWLDLSILHGALQPDAGRYSLMHWHVCVFNRQNQKQLQTYWYTRDSRRLSKDPNYWLSNSHQDDNTSLCTARPTRALTAKPCSDAVMQWELGTVLRLSSSCPATALTAGKAQVAPNSPGWHCLRTKSNHRSHLHPKPTKKKKVFIFFLSPK